MSEIKCKAFNQHRCMKNAAKTPLACCHSCAEYESCVERCENKPRSCNMSEVTNETLFHPTEKARRSKKKRIGMYDADTGELLEVFASLKEAAKHFPDREFGSIATTIGRCANGGQKTANGYKWRYLD